MNTSRQNAVNMLNYTEQCSDSTDDILSGVDYDQVIVSAEANKWISLITNAFVCLLATFLGIPGNVLSAMVFYRQGLRERINLCFFALALVDLLILFPYVVDFSERLYKQIVRATEFIWQYTVTLSGTALASQFLSAVIASERCFCVVSPFHAKRLLKTSTMAAIIVICCALLIGGVVVIMGPKFAIQYSRDPQTNLTITSVSVTTYYLDNRTIIDVMDIFIYSIALPAIFLIVVIVSTSITIVKVRAALAWRQRAASSVMKTSVTKTTSEDPAHLLTSKKELSVTLMQIFSSVLFAIHVTPNLIVQMCISLVPDLNSTGRYHNFSNLLWNLVYLLRTANSSVNVVVYYKTGTKFRETLQKMISRRRTQ